MNDKIIIKGAREHNLKNISLELPRNKLICFTGLSGSGKSSLAFDTIFAEGQRRYVESLSAYARQFLGQMEKPDVDEIEGLSPAISIDQKAHSANPRSTVATVTEIYDYLRVLFARVGRPHCPKCLREIHKLTNEEMVDVVLREVGEGVRGGQKDRGVQEAQGAQGKRKTGEVIKILAPVVRGRKGEYYQLLYDLYNSGFARVRIDGKEYALNEQIKLTRYQQHTIEVVIDTISISLLIGENKDGRQRLAEGLQTAVEKGNDVALIIYPNGVEQLLSSKFSCPEDGFSFPEIEPRLFSFNSPYGACEHCHGLGTAELFSEELCGTCHGARLRPEALHVWLPAFISQKKEKEGMSIVDVTSLSIEQASEYFLTLDLSEREQEIAGPALREILNRLQFMLDVGLHYLTLNRIAGSLSGGEAQRIRLASQVGSRLVGALYVLDEPTIGLHQRDNERLIQTLTELRDLGNTVIVVEHDEDTVRASDYMVEIGPGAGIHGGEVIAAGVVPEVFQDPKSLTGAYLRGDKEIAIPSKRREVGRDVIKIRGAQENNLKHVDVDIPLRRFVCVTGVSGSGKSTLAYDTMYKELSRRLYGSKPTPGKHKAVLGAEYIDKAILIDQSAIGRTPRSNPATYTGAWGPIRELFCATAEARFRGYKPGRFSFNVPGGRCENCEGHGTIAIEMHFLPTVYVTCDVCKGRRFDRETLEIEYKEKNVFDVLGMTIEEAAIFFQDIPFVSDKMDTLNQVGLGYLKLGQSAPTLSGGEAQRVKLASELSKRSTGRTLYLLDEPTTGLHFADIEQLLKVLHALVDKGNSVIVIEHNLDVIKTADWLIDLGPEGGDKGGEIVCTGTPEEVARHAKSYTGQYLRRVLKM
ncbi:MAG: Excinuclease ABC, subunit A [Candidatus Uhrbacteria bacterium GW2011_GWC2_41_11]|uniref:UvrABC system protein A n=1 Tax=Candidatus Uhrbacteria bacterium GW2011_GWC2_41_11 TaxID=1618985 RepID=A0A0G0UFV3_9BACT|nr:MAG: Excinuclease ABC, subunit A [Candidatus Uhrbacteria bacterium GW2011_GWC2_41_11]